MGIFYLCSKCNKQTDNTCNSLLCLECDAMPKTKRQKWQAWELAWIDTAIQNIYIGYSIYSQIEFLKDNEMPYRTRESIRSKIGKKLRANKDLLSRKGEK